MNAQQAEHLLELCSLLDEAKDSDGDEALSVTLLLKGRQNDDDDFGGLVVDRTDVAVRIESPSTRTIEWIDLAQIDRAWTGDLNGNVPREWRRPA